MKKKSILSAALLAMSAMSVQAGGLLTNSNQNAAFLRYMAQNGLIDIAGIYANPAGSAFLSNGWHISLNSQTAIQQRNISTTFPYFALNTENNSATHEFKGEALAPVIPSLSVVYNKDKWSLSAHFALTGGGGKCEFDKGLGSFETLYSSTLAQQLPGMVNGMVKSTVLSGLESKGVPSAMAADLVGNGTFNSSMTGYSLDAFMRGRSYYFGLQLGGTYKFNDKLAGFVGVRGVYATCNYYGYVQDVKASYAYNYSVPTAALLGANLTGSDTGSQVLGDNTLTLNADQTGFGITPIIGIDYKMNDQWNFAAKFEAPTKMNLKNKSEMNNFAAAQASQPGNVLAQFADGTKVREDIPGILSLGTMYSPTEKFRMGAGYNMYFDKSAKKYGDKQDLIDHNTWELNASVEYDLTSRLSASASWQTTQYGLSDEYMNDLSFNLSNNMVGLGLRYKATDRLSIDLGYMHTIYGDRSVSTLGGAKTDIYSRKNDVVAIGFNLDL